MGKYFVELWLDGYDNDEEREAAEIEFIEQQLDFSGSSVKVWKAPEVKKTYLTKMELKQKCEHDIVLHEVCPTCSGHGAV